MRQEDGGTIGPTDVLLAAPLAPAVFADDFRALLIQLRPLFLGEEFPVRILGRSLERGLVIVRPDALEVRFTPRGLGWRARLDVASAFRGRRRGLAGDRRDPHLQERAPDHDHRCDTDHLEHSFSHGTTPWTPVPTPGPHQCQGPAVPVTIAASGCPSRLRLQFARPAWKHGMKVIP